jgi:hypothetical protein
VEGEEAKLQAFRRVRDELIEKFKSFIQTDQEVCYVEA